MKRKTRVTISTAFLCMAMALSACGAPAPTAETTLETIAEEVTMSCETVEGTVKQANARLTSSTSILSKTEEEIAALPEKESSSKNNILLQNDVAFAKEMAKEVFDKINAERVEAGLDELEWNEDLYELAMTRCYENDSHRSVRAGTGENYLAAHKRYAEASSDVIHNLWHDSEGHYNNYMNDSYANCAVAIMIDEYGNYVAYEVFTYEDNNYRADVTKDGYRVNTEIPETVLAKSDATTAPVATLVPTTAPVVAQKPAETAKPQATTAPVETAKPAATTAPKTENKTTTSTTTSTTTAKTKEQINKELDELSKKLSADLKEIRAKEAEQKAAKEANLSASTEDMKAMAKEVFDKINAERKAAGLNELVWDEGLYELAFTRCDENDKHASKRTGTGENYQWATYEADADKIHENWKNSTGHYKNYMSDNNAHGAVGIKINEDGSYTAYELFTDEDNNYTTKTGVEGKKEWYENMGATYVSINGEVILDKRAEQEAKVEADRAERQAKIEEQKKALEEEQKKEKEENAAKRAAKEAEQKAAAEKAKADNAAKLEAQRLADLEATLKAEAERKAAEEAAKNNGAVEIPAEPETKPEEYMTEPQPVPEEPDVKEEAPEATPEPTPEPEPAPEEPITAPKTDDEPERDPDMVEFCEKYDIDYDDLQKAVDEALANPGEAIYF
ncbi:MAG: hypothetical protein J6A94_02210 [Lachnospiraceae bacterium]|nr:hypothetical protein [Lachnospiraceae bacterium]